MASESKGSRFSRVPFLLREHVYFGFDGAGFVSDLRLSYEPLKGADLIGLTGRRKPYPL